MKRSVCGVVCALGLVTIAPVIRAQSMESSRTTAPVKFGIEGGATIPVGSTSDGVKTGWNAGALLDFSVPQIPFGLRLDGTYHQLAFKGGGGKVKLLGGDLNALFMIPMQAGEGTIRPYITGGPGVYWVKSDSDVDTQDNSQTKFALNGGAGVRFDLAGFGTFVEGRYLHIFTNGESVKLIPIVFGIMFGGNGSSTGSGM